MFWHIDVLTTIWFKLQRIDFTLYYIHIHILMFSHIFEIIYIFVHLVDNLALDCIWPVWAQS